MLVLTALTAIHLGSALALGGRLRHFVSPFNLIWLAGLLFVAGSLITMWPDEQEQRRLARRGAPVPATP